MKPVQYFFLFFAIISCNSNNPDLSEEKVIEYSETLIQQSPWVLDRVEITDIEGIDGYIFTQSEIEEIAKIMKNNFYCTFDFYNDGTGLWSSEGWCPDCKITWKEVFGENQINWSHRSYIHKYNIQVTNQVTEIIWETNNENGFAITKPDNTIVKGKRLIANYVWN